jgi:peptidoglycan/LPS O-acetylase OafA/YrhL
LRGIAVLMVIAIHYLRSTPPGIAPPICSEILRRIVSTGWSGVDLFFVLSGFLLGGQLMDNQGSPGLIATFMRRRMARTLPLYLILVAGYLAVAPGAKALPMLTLTQNLFWAFGRFPVPYWMSPTWSLALEEQFYLLLPFVIRAVPRRRLPILLIVLVVAAPIFRVWIVLKSHDVWSAYLLLPSRVDALAIGIAVAWIHRNKPDVNQAHLRLALSVLAMGFLYATLADTDSPSRRAWVIGYTWVDLFFAAILLLLLTNPRLRWNRWLIELGAISYPMYLFHLPVLVAICSWLGSGPIQTVAAFLITIALSGLLHLIVEKPIHQWARDRWSYTREPEPNSPDRIPILEVSVR